MHNLEMPLPGTRRSVMTIQSLELASVDPRAISEFYAQCLDLVEEPVESSDSSLLWVGPTNLTFRKVEERSPPYHFAINIHPGSFKKWLARLESLRIDVLKDSTGESSFRFESWQASSVYFRDPDGNIAELIARDNIPHDAWNHLEEGNLSSTILGVSEIGLVVPNVSAFTRTLNIPQYQESSEAFAALGDPNGLLIVVKQGREWYPNTGVMADSGSLSVKWIDRSMQSWTLAGPPYVATSTHISE